MLPERRQRGGHVHERGHRRTQGPQPPAGKHCQWTTGWSCFCWPSVLGRKQAAGLEPGKIGAHALQGAACTKMLVRQVLSKDEEHVQALRGLLRGLLCPLHSPRNASAS